MAKQSSDKISIDRMRSEAIHQDKGTMTPKVPWRILLRSLPFHTQDAKLKRRK